MRVALRAVLIAGCGHTPPATTPVPVNPCPGQPKGMIWSRKSPCEAADKQHMAYPDAPYSQPTKKASPRKAKKIR